VLEPSLAMVTRLAVDTLSNSLKVENNPFKDAQILSIYNRRGVSALQEYLKARLVEEWGGDPKYSTLQPPPERILPDPTRKAGSGHHKPIKQSQGAPIAQKTAFGITVGQGVTAPGGQQTPQQHTSVGGVVGNAMRQSGGNTNPHAQLAQSKEVETLKMLTNMTLETVGQLVQSLKETAAQVAQFTSSAQLVPVMTKLKGLKEDETVLREFVPAQVAEMRPSQSQDQLVRAKEIVVVNLSNLVVLMNSVSVWLRGSPPRESLIPVCGSIKNINLKWKST